MTVSNTTSRWAYTGDGATTAFAYGNLIFAATDLKVYVAGVLKTLSTHYTVSGVGTPKTAPSPSSPRPRTAPPC